MRVNGKDFRCEECGQRVEYKLGCWWCPEHRDRCRVVVHLPAPPISPQRHAAAQLLRAAAKIVRDAHGELARDKPGDGEFDYDAFNEMTERASPIPFDRLADELEYGT